MVDIAPRPQTLRRKAGVGLSLVAFCLLAVAACGGGGVSLSEYVGTVNAEVEQTQERADQLIAEGNLRGDLTPPELQAALQRVLQEVRIPLQEAMDGIDPPQQVAVLHSLLWVWHADLIRVESALAERVGTTPDTEAGWAEFSNSPEVVAYRASIAEGKEVCIDFQAELDATAARGAFEGVAWVPSEFSEVVAAALGCESFPEDPDSIYRFPLP